MKPKSPLPARVTEYLFIAGIAILGFGLAAKDWLPQSFSSQPVFQFTCAFFSSVLIPFSSFLALRTLLTDTHFRRKMIVCHLFAQILLVVILAWYFAAYATINRVLEIYSPTSFLPKLVEDARTFPTEQKRAQQAKWAYRIYGVTIAYRLDNSQVAYYQPTPEDVAAWNSNEKADGADSKSTAFVRKITGQLPYLFALYASTFFATYLAGGTSLIVHAKTEPRKLAIEH